MDVEVGGASVEVERVQGEGAEFADPQAGQEEGLDDEAIPGDVSADRDEWSWPEGSS